MSGPSAKNINILLVADENELLMSTTRMLKSCSYEVARAGNASIGLLILLNRNQSIDLVLAKLHPEDTDGYEFLKEVDRLRVPLILMTSDSNLGTEITAIEAGAILVLERPITVEVLKYLWQLVLSDKRRRISQLSSRGHENDENRVETEEANSDEDENDNGVDMQGAANNNGLTKKESAHWTKELHAKFMDAVNQLGERCFPKDILQKMNVSELTRMQVASHLQKCRLQNPNFPKEADNIVMNGPSNPEDVAYPHRQSNNNMMRMYDSMLQLPTENIQEPLETHTVNLNQSGVFSQWQNQNQVPQLPPLQVPAQWYNNTNSIPGVNIEAYGVDRGLASQYGMPNIYTTENNYLPPGSQVLATPQLQFQGRYGNFGSEADFALQNFNLQSQIASTSQVPNLDGLGLDLPYIEEDMPFRNNTENNYPYAYWEKF